MDLEQRKLTKAEWDSIEKQIPASEKEILQMIISGYGNVNIKYNKNRTILSHLKIEETDQVHDYIFQKYYLDKIVDIATTYNIPGVGEPYKFLSKKLKNMKKTMIIRMQRYTSELIEKEDLLENTLISTLTGMLAHKHGNKKTKPSQDWLMHYYTLHNLFKIGLKANIHVRSAIQNIMSIYENDVSIKEIIRHSDRFIEQNKTLLVYADMTLFEHQKQIFTICKNPDPKLVLYTAPTGTGKTLTPIGLLGGHKIIFVCAARHVGLALAKSAINMQKKVAFAFGCDTADDIRLHYFSAKDFTKNRVSGGIWKVDNSVGDNVELMICDVKSYLPAMYYMLAFNDKSSVITYWDEPTITLDYSDHPCHEIIHKNWTENLIPNMVLSSATLPKVHEIANTVADFRNKFPGSETAIHNIQSSDCKKSVPLVNKKGYIISPHVMSVEYETTQRIVKHCIENPVLLRYLDMYEISKCIIMVNDNNNTFKTVDRYFASIDDVTMMNVKKYYLYMLDNIIDGAWGGLYLGLQTTMERVDVRAQQHETLRKTQSLGEMPSSYKRRSNEGESLKRVQSVQPVTSDHSSLFGTFITTSDAHTLTDGPTIYLSDEPEKIAKFCIQQANIPETVLTDLLGAIEYNNKLNTEINKLQHALEDALPKDPGSGSGDTGKSKTTEKTNKTERSMSNNTHAASIREKLDAYRKMIKIVQLNDMFVPNKKAHLERWVNVDTMRNAFTSSISDHIVERIMTLNDVSNSWKILLMMGIGVFTQHKSIEYTEIMKELADQQSLYLIIASGDYVYGTNYQFCHGYISKDMGLTQEKTIQAIGRVGRNGIQQRYTVRFRDDSLISTLFNNEDNRPEATNMNRLFSSGS